MSIFQRKKQFETQSPEEKSLINRTNNFLEATERFFKTTAGAIASVTLLLGAIDWLKQEDNSNGQL
ncbi:MAG: hypothetical protein QNJ72_19525 [Pleurocapsa sp. MO_226.B13]|nr:hypothetical protein [Pleurocapsa sp. MO_226.B13]